MNKAIYITADTVGTPTGGGTVTRHELEALRSIAEEVTVLSEANLSPVRWGLPDSPFLSDTLAAWEIERRLSAGEHFDLACIYSGTFSQTVRLLHQHGARVSYTCPAHDRQVSIEEFQRLGLEYPFSHISNDVLWRLFVRGVLEADLVIAPSKLAADFLRAEGCQHIATVPHGCYYPEKVAPLPDTLRACYLGVTGPDKGVHYLLEAWSSLDYKDAVLCLGGSGTELLADHIHRNLNGGIFQLLGRVDNIGEFFANCSIHIQPSACESFGIPLLEAMAHGRAVVCSQGAGAADLVTDGEDGFIVPIRDPGAIAEKIDWLKRHPNKMAEMGRRAREKAEGYTWQKIRERYKQVWQEL